MHSPKFLKTRNRAHNSQMRLDFQTGIIEPSIHTSVRRLRDVVSIFADQSALAEMDPETVVYETYGCAGDGAGEELYYGTTVLHAGQVGSEYFMTRGHFHTHPLRGELCIVLQGRGQLVLMDRSGESSTESMSAGSIHNIPGETAHRVVNTGTAPLIFFVAWLSDCGHDYEDTLKLGFPIISNARQTQ